MAKFLLLGHGGTPPATKEEGEAFMGRWMTWFGKVGKAVTDPGAPFMNKESVGTVASPTAGNGYMIVEAVDMAAAKELAASCPAAIDGDGMEVIQLADMSPK